VKGRLYLIPVTLGGNDLRMLIPDRVLETTKRLRYFVVEDIRSARRYLRSVDNEFPIDESHFLELNEHTRDEDIVHYLDPVLNGSDMGLMSEAGMPAIADPGSRLIAIAHRKMIPVVPLPGPSSILLALVSSGLNGQKFMFHGYLPVKPADRAVKLKELERNAGTGYSQIFMETPYRNNSMLDTILSVCRNDTLLCIAADLTLPTEFIRTMRITEWRNSRPDLNRRPAVYVMQ
jgi:16S rRNA (cytidine1402-2'-O)-methyltransferase